MEDLKAVIDRISQVSGIFELAQETKFTGYLDGVGEIEVTVRDRATNDRTRYSVSARTLDIEPERIAAGNPEADLDMAIIGVHWNKLKN